MCAALTSITSKLASKMLNTGRQYSPVLSIATEVQLCWARDNRSKSQVMLGFNLFSPSTLAVRGDGTSDHSFLERQTSTVRVNNLHCL